MPIYAIARKAVPANGTGIKQRPLQDRRNLHSGEVRGPIPAYSTLGCFTIELHSRFRRTIRSNSITHYWRRHF
jgi:hypothetical protein